MSLPKFNYFTNPDSQVLNVVMHGGSGGIESPFIQKVFNCFKDKGENVIAFNFPFLDRGEEKSSGPELKEELEALQQILNHANYKNFRNIRLVAKSLGGIVASFYLSNLSKSDNDKFSVVVLGYVTGDIKLQNFSGSITIIQGEKDKFGDISAVKKDMKNTQSQSIKFVEISGADHSYRQPETKEPIYEEEVINIL